MLRRALLTQPAPGSRWPSGRTLVAKWSSSIDRTKEGNMAAKKDSGRKVVSENRRARFEYAILDTYEAGIELKGTEVKSLRRGEANIADSYASPESGGIVLINAYIGEYQQAHKFFQH